MCCSYPQAGVPTDAPPPFLQGPGAGDGYVRAKHPCRGTSLMRNHHPQAGVATGWARVASHRRGVQQAARCAAIVLAREQTSSLRRAVRGWAQHPKPRTWYPKAATQNRYHIQKYIDIHTYIYIYICIYVYVCV